MTIPLGKVALLLHFDRYCKVDPTAIVDNGEYGYTAGNTAEQVAAAAKWGASGLNAEVGKSCVFSNADVVPVSDGQGGGPFTRESWVKFPASVSDNTWYSLHTTNPSLRIINYHLTEAAGVYTMHVLYLVTGIATKQWSYDVTSYYETSNWHHFVCLRDNTQSEPWLNKVAFGIDGDILTTAATSIDDANTRWIDYGLEPEPVNVYIGNYLGNANVWGGYLDELRFTTDLQFVSSGTFPATYIVPTGPYAPADNTCIPQYAINFYESSGDAYPINFYESTSDTHPINFYGV